FDGGLRFGPARVVVVPGGLVDARGQVVVGTDPVGGVDHAGLQGGEHLAAGHDDRGGADAADDFAAQAGHADLQALEVLDAVDFLVEPAAHLHAGVAAQQG